MNNLEETDQMLNIPFQIPVDNSIAHWETYSYESYGPRSYNNSDEIPIKIQNQDIYLHPHKSSLHVVGRLLKSNGDACEFTKINNNGILHLFDEIKYKLNGEEIDRCKTPGLTCTLKGFVSFNKNQLHALENSGWTYNQEDSKIPNANGHFDVSIPLSYLFGFAEDYAKVIIKATHEIVLIRANNDLNAIVQSQAEDVKFEISKIVWRMPQVHLSDLQRANMMQKYEQKDRAIPIVFRTWELYEYPMLPRTKKQLWTIKTSSQMEKPRYVIFALQTDRKNKATKNCSTFDNCNLNNVKFYLNAKEYPHGDLNLDFEKDQYSLLYDMYANFQSSYYGYNTNEVMLNKHEFATDAPLVVVDASRQSDQSKSAVVDVRIEFESKNIFPNNTAAYCLLIHDSVVEYRPITGIVRRVI